jgi:hypothetical protein
MLMGLGLAGAAGLNAYIPLLVVGLMERFNVIDFGSRYHSLSSTAALIVLAVLLAVEVVADKVPAVDSVNDVVQTFIRPVAGAVLFAGSIGVLPHTPSWVGLVAGLTTAGGVHITKATVRPAINLSTGGLGAPVVSAIEDVVSTVASVLAILAPVLLVGFVAAVVGWVWWSVRRFRVRRAIA